jgi:hypothetical protein
MHIRTSTLKKLLVLMLQQLLNALRCQNFRLLEPLTNFLQESAYMAMTADFLVVDVHIRLLI